MENERKEPSIFHSYALFLFPFSLFISSNYQDFSPFPIFLLQRSDIKSAVVVLWGKLKREKNRERRSKERVGGRSNLNIKKIEEAFEKK